MGWRGAVCYGACVKVVCVHDSDSLRVCFVFCVGVIVYGQGGMSEWMRVEMIKIDAQSRGPKRRKGSECSDGVD